MTFRRVTSLLLALSIVVVSVTGILSYTSDYSRTVAALHTIFGFLLIVGICFHMVNNIKPLKKYMGWKVFPLLFLLVATLFGLTYFQVKPISRVMEFGARLKATDINTEDPYSFTKMNTEGVGRVPISIELLKASFYWHPQIAIWIEDANGNYLETLYVTKATAKGLFFGGRTKENFKSYDAEVLGGSDYRNVNALPIWSHKWSQQSIYGIATPTVDHPLPDAISGATPPGSFVLRTNIPKESDLILNLEINVAFDDNEFYSEFDFPDDSIFHNGTGLLGQPSILFKADIDATAGENHILMKLHGRGHHSGQNGNVIRDTKTLTTALNIVERIVVGIHPSESMN